MGSLTSWWEHTRQEDESLRRHKAALLGPTQTEKTIVDANDQGKVIMKKLALVVEGRVDMELDLTGVLSQTKEQVFVIEDGVYCKCA